jgi:hypothetical protein
MKGDEMQKLIISIPEKERKEILAMADINEEVQDKDANLNPVVKDIFEQVDIRVKKITEGLISLGLASPEETQDVKKASDIMKDAIRSLSDNVFGKDLLNSLGLILTIFVISPTDLREINLFIRDAMFADRASKRKD